MSPSEQAFALDFDAAVMRIGMDYEKQIREQMEARRGPSVSITKVMGR